MEERAAGRDSACVLEHSGASPSVVCVYVHDSGLTMSHLMSDTSKTTMAAQTTDVLDMISSTLIGTLRFVHNTKCLYYW